MSMNRDLRPTFFEGQYLSASDLEATVDYAKTLQARENLGGHTWGIAAGFQVVETAGPGGDILLTLSAGHAWDGHGRQLTSTASQPISSSLFSDFTFDSSLDGGATPGRLVYLWLKYSEAETRFAGKGFETCGVTNTASRVEESFTIVSTGSKLIPQASGQIVVNGSSVSASDRTVQPDYDESVPYQDLSGVEASQEWYVPVGVVRYLPDAGGSGGAVQARTADDLVEDAAFRRDVGIVAKTVEAPSGLVRVHDRKKVYSALSSSELFRVEGDARIDGKLYLDSTSGSPWPSVEFRSSSTEASLPIGFKRTDEAGAAASKQLRALIGNDNKGSNYFVVGPVVSSVFEPKMVVRDDGKVGIGTTAPLAPLHVPEDGIQFGTVAGNAHFYAFVDATNKAFKLCSGDFNTGTPIASFLPEFGGVLQGDLYLTGGAKWCSLAKNAKHDSANATWNFPLSTEPAMALDFKTDTGKPVFEIIASPLGDNQSFKSHLSINGHDKTVALAPNGGTVSVGAAANLADLSVNGDEVVTGEIVFSPSAFSPVACQGQFKMIAGVVSGTGAIVQGTGFTVTKGVGPGEFTINFTSAFSGTPVVVATAINGAYDAEGIPTFSSPRAVIDSGLPDHALIVTWDGNSNPANFGFTFMAFGGR